MNWLSVSSLELPIVLFFLLECGITKATITTDEARLPRVIVPASHTALSGDLTILILTPMLAKSTTVANPAAATAETKTEYISNATASVDVKAVSNYNETISANSISLRLLYQNDLSSELIGEFSTKMLSFENENTSLVIPCAVFSREGTYHLQLRYKLSDLGIKDSNINDSSEIQVNSALQVNWPMPSLVLEPRHFDTYPNRPILATLKYNGISCLPSKKSMPVSVYTLNLIYCGLDVASCEPLEQNRSHVLYYEELRGFAVRKIIALRCEFFGLAGDYVLSYKALGATSNASAANAYMKVTWSDEFKFNVHARSIYPCESSGGVAVLFEYPSCRLQGDRVRVYGRLRADVASYAPPSTLHYITELKAPPGKYTLNFDCDVFTEKFVEYCFAYVSEAITGAMAEVRIACIPTFPLQESDAGGWGPWSPWTSCSSSCYGGTRSRYRFCDTPPPSYGARFCQGKAVETEACGGSNFLHFPRSAWNVDDWKCRHGTGMRKISTEVSGEIGVKCRCGCIISLQREISKKVLAANTQACPGRSFWLLQAISNFVIILHLEQVQFPCPGQYFRVRDGDSLNANLLTDIAFDKNAHTTGSIVSTGQNLLVEFYSDEVSAAIESCVGGFLAHAATFYRQRVENGTLPLVPLESNSTTAVGQLILWTTPAHLVAASLLIFIFFISMFLALQFALKYRKYHVAKDLDDLNDNFLCGGSMQNVARLPKTLSSTTLISEVMSLVADSKKIIPRNVKVQKETQDIEDGYESSGTQTEYGDESGTSSDTLKLNQSEENQSRETIVPSKFIATDKLTSISGTAVIGQPEIKYARPIKLRTLESKNPAEEKLKHQRATKKNDETSHGASNALRAKKFSSITSTASRTGKDTKDRRNRERLLQGPASEFGLTQPDMDLELDYYDYDVANAGAAPGSYLGMDPAFLVWIPPLTTGDSENSTMDDVGGFQETVPSITEFESKIGLDGGGLTLTPLEYKRFMSSKVIGDGCDRSWQTMNAPSKESFIESYVPDGGMHSIGGSIERRAKLNERLLPLHRILEDSRVRVSEEYLAGQVSSNKMEPSPEKVDNRTFEEHAQSLSFNVSNCNRPSGVGNNIDGVDITNKFNGRSVKMPTDITEKHLRSVRYCNVKYYVHQKAKESFQDEKKNLNVGEDKLDKPYGDTSEARKKSFDETSSTYEVEKLTRNSQRTKSDETSDLFTSYRNGANAPYRRKDFTHFTRPCEDKKVTNYINIPMTELSDFQSLQSSPKIFKSIADERITLPKGEIQTSDHEVEIDARDELRDPLYFLTRDSEDVIKFVDDDDDDEDDESGNGGGIRCIANNNDVT